MSDNDDEKAAERITAAVTSKGPREKLACGCMATPRQKKPDGKWGPVLEVIGKNADTGEDVTRAKPALAGRTADGGICPHCLGFTWLWTDGHPPTACPSNRAGLLRLRPGVKPWEALLLPCGRRADTCGGCHRGFDDVVSDDDKARTLAWRKEAEAMKAAAEAKPGTA